MSIAREGFFHRRHNDDTEMKNSALSLEVKMLYDKYAVDQTTLWEEYNECARIYQLFLESDDMQALFELSRTSDFQTDFTKHDELLSRLYNQLDVTISLIDKYIEAISNYSHYFSMLTHKHMTQIRFPDKLSSHSELMLLIPILKFIPVQIKHHYERRDNNLHADCMKKISEINDKRVNRSTLSFCNIL